MGRKEEYRLRNEQYIADVAKEEGVCSIGKSGVLYRVMSEGSGVCEVRTNSVVTVNYRGSLITGRVFDDSWKRGCPEAFRVNELIEGFQIALCNMSVGDCWKVYIPWSKGYGKRSSGDIPAYSTLVFEIELLSVM